MKKEELAYLTTMVINQQFELEEKAIKSVLESNGIEWNEENAKKVTKKIVDNNYTDFIFSFEGVDLGHIKHELENANLKLTLTPL